MCGKKEYFIDFVENFEDIQLGSNISLVVLGQGNIRLQVDGILQVIIGGFYVPEL